MSDLIPTRARRLPVRALTIWKFPLRIDDELTITMPRGARLLSLDVQGGTPHLWALVDPSERLVARRLALRGTGHSCDTLEHSAFVGTFLLGAFVGHVFDRGEAEEATHATAR